MAFQEGYRSLEEMGIVQKWNTWGYWENKPTLGKKY
tara:strand:+ start:415 stop:522 length:108 start_codon:yes stop_codon:yes gene_type:complete